MYEKKKTVHEWLGYCPTVSQYNEKLYFDTAGLRGLNGCGFMLQYKNCIVTGATGRLGKCIAIGDCIATWGCSGSWCIAIGRLDVWGKFVSQYTKCIVTGEEA